MIGWVRTDLPICTLANLKCVKVCALPGAEYSCHTRMPVTEEETETQRDEVACPRPTASRWSGFTLSSSIVSAVSPYLQIGETSGKSRRSG